MGSSVLIPLILPKSKSSALYSRLDDAGWFVAATPAILEEVYAGVKILSHDAFRDELDRLGVP